MKEETFLATHSSTWRQLEHYCERMKHGGQKNLATSDIKQFLILFKQASHHLAYAKTHYEGSRTIPYLNNLVARCNTYVYAVPKPNLTTYLQHLFFDYTYHLKKYRSYVLLALGIFLAGFLLSGILTLSNSENAYLFLDGSIVNNVKELKSSANQTVSNWNYPLMSSYIMTNNITVALKAFIYGITLGLGTCYILFANGLTLGSLTALYYLYGDPFYYWSLILPHGVFELTAIFIAGGAGFMIAKSFLIPGKLSRINSLIHSTKKALNLLGGIIILLVVAAIIEGFFTPLSITPAAKLLFALLTAVLTAAYILIPYVKSRT